MKNLICLLLCLSILSTQAQKVTGYWYGQANVEMSGIQNNYLTELIISQKGTKVKGYFGYYFKDVYQSFLVKGTYDPKTKKIIINDIPIIYYQTNSTANSVDCITSFYGTLRQSKVKTELSGYFYRDKKYQYTCPDLRVNYTLYNEAKVEDSIFKDMSVSKTFWQPTPTPVDLVKGEDAKKATALAEISDASKANSDSKKSKVADVTPVRNSYLDTTASIVKDKKAPLEQSSIITDLSKINDNFRKRKTIVSKQIEVTSDSLRLSFYDNAEVDGDSISVFLNGKLIIAHQALSERAFNIYVQLDTNKDINEVSMFAENLGKYPPNTALMVVSDGDKRYETFLSSDFKGNATINFKLRKNSVAGNQ